MTRQPKHITMLWHWDSMLLSISAALAASVYMTSATHSKGLNSVNGLTPSPEKGELSHILINQHRCHVPFMHSKLTDHSQNGPVFVQKKKCIRLEVGSA
jgi:hypothetical protein